VKSHAKASAEPTMSRGSLPRRLRIVASLAFCALLLLALAPQALAVKTVDRFIGVGTTGNLGGQFNAHRDVAVNETGAGAADPGDIYVSEISTRRIQVFDAKGNFKFAFGKDVDSGNPGTGYEICTLAANCKTGVYGSQSGEFASPHGIAIDQADGSIYVWDSRGGSAETNARIQKFDAAGGFLLMFGKGVNATTGGDVCTQASGNVCGPGSSGTAAGQLGAAASTIGTGIAVDPTAPHDVFVADPQNRRVQRFTSGGTFVAAFGSSANFASNQPQRVAVDSRGIVYASDSGGSPTGKVERYDSLNANGGGVKFLAPITGTTLGGSGANFGLEVDPDSDGAGPDEDVLYVLRDPGSGNTVVRQYGPVNDPGLTAAPVATDAIHLPTEIGTVEVGGLGLNSATGTLYVTVGSNLACGGSCVGVFAADDDGTGPIDAQVSAPVNVGSTSADVSGTVDPGGGVVTYRFEVSADGNTWVALPVGKVEGTGPQPVSKTATGLDPNSNYRVRLVATKIVGTNSVLTDASSEAVFVTDAAPPGVVTLPVGPRTSVTAELRGTVDPNGTATTYWFEYGPDANYGTVVPVPAAPAGSGNEALPVYQQVSGLVPGATYHYRLVADGFGAPVYGADEALTTQAVSPPQPGLGARSFELVSPADKVAGVGVGQWYIGPGSFAGQAGVAAYGAERFAAQGRFGANLMDGSHSYSNDWALAERSNGQVGWQSHSPFTHPNHTTTFATFLDMQATSEDLSTVFWLSNHTPTIFPELEDPAWGAFDAGLLSDWGSSVSPTRWELMGPSSLDQLVDHSGSEPSIWDVNLSADGSTAVGTTAAALPANVARVVGLAGAGDPTNPAWGAPAGELVSGRSVYLADLSGGLGDAFAKTGERELVNVCTGTSGVDRTQLPSIDGSGDLAAEECAESLPGRDSRLVSDHGATFSPGSPQEVAAVLRGEPANVISRDGARVFFLSPDTGAAGVPDGIGEFCESSGDVCPPQLYVRQRNSDGSLSVRWISRAAPGLFETQDASLTGSVRFEGATPDGDKVFFRTNSPLTADDPNGSGAPAPAGGVKSGVAGDSSWDLYEYDLPDGPDGDPATPDADPAGGTLTRVSAGPNGDGDCNSPVPSLGKEGIDNDNAGALRFLSDDGRRAYFTCAAPLPGVPAAQDGTVTAPGGSAGATTDALNLYAYDAGRPASQGWRFVARLPRSDSDNVEGCASTGVGAGSPFTTNDQDGGIYISQDDLNNCVRGTSDGDFITLWTTSRLTADDPAGTATGDLYGYDLEKDSLTRISAAQGGLGGTYECAQFNPNATGSYAVRCYGDGGVDYVGHLDANASLGVATDPTVAGDRLAFFQSASRLVPEDTDNAYDVYAWRNGELSLLTPGTASDTFYKGNDRSGRNVYFATRDALTWQDFDAVADVYTARIGGGIPEPPPPPACEVLGGSCQGSPPAAPPASNPGSATLAGSGNVFEPKKKHHKKKHHKKNGQKQKKGKRVNGRAGK
jgi:hypothetical protein